jgi:5-oxoprolinase (ATP-hydrolysing)
MVGWYCGPAILRALAPALPERVQGFTGMPMSATAYGMDGSGRIFNDSLFQGGGQGAGAHGDGKSALLFPTSAASTPVELFETRTPLVVEAKELIPDSGGAGRHRGGLGQRVSVRKLHDDGRPVQIGLLPQGVRTDIPGQFGGRPGRRGAIRYEGAASTGDDLPGLVELREPTDRLELEMGGGSGYGLPQKRPVEEVQADYDAGLVTEPGLAAYGCRLNATGRVERP